MILTYACKIPAIHARILKNIHFTSITLLKTNFEYTSGKIKHGVSHQVPEMHFGVTYEKTVFYFFLNLIELTFFWFIQR